ncbi:hypothetical protein H5T87_07925 [bacterium]|nr:hypothetical protein [bacterium]
MKEKLAHFFSLLLHPSAVAIYLFSLAGFLTPGAPSARLLWSLVGIFFSALVPGLVVLAFLKAKLLSDPDITNRLERIRPYILITLLYFLGAFILLYLPPKPLNRVLGILMSCYATVTLTGTVITYFWKISMHLSGLVGPITASIFFWKLPAVPSLIAILPLAWARLHLKKHNIWQILAGILMSSLVTFLTCYLLSGIFSYQ